MIMEEIKGPPDVRLGHNECIKPVESQEWMHTKRTFGPWNEKVTMTLFKL